MIPNSVQLFHALIIYPCLIQMTNTLMAVGITLLTFYPICAKHSVNMKTSIALFEFFQ